MGKSKHKKLWAPWEVYAKDRSVIQANIEQVEFLLDMGYSTPTVASVVGVRPHNLSNWRHKEYTKVTEQDGEQPFLVCDRFTFKNMLDPRTQEEYLELQTRIQAVYSILNEKLPDRERRLLSSYMLMGQTVRQIGDSENLTGGRICQIVAKAMRRLEFWAHRHPDLKKGEDS